MAIRIPAAELCRSFRIIVGWLAVKECGAPGYQFSRAIEGHSAASGGVVENPVPHPVTGVEIREGKVPLDLVKPDA